LSVKTVTLAAPSTLLRSCLLAASLACLAGAQERPPAVPLVAHNPYFSIWSMADKLTDRETSHWTGAGQPLTGLARIDGKSYRFMGSEPRDLPAMNQVSLKVTPTHTIYKFQTGQVNLTVSFFTQLLPSWTYPIRRELQQLVYQALVD